MVGMWKSGRAEQWMRLEVGFEIETQDKNKNEKKTKTNQIKYKQNKIKAYYIGKQRMKAQKVMHQFLTAKHM